MGISASKVILNRHNAMRPAHLRTPPTQVNTPALPNNTETSSAKTESTGAADFLKQEMKLAAVNTNSDDSIQLQTDSSIDQLRGAMSADDVQSLQDLD